MDDKVKYYGEWQSGSIILQKLCGPKGDGRVEFPNGDIFEGVFYLSFANISGPCYVACGKYTFADGSYIERAWIDTSENLSKFGLKGVYEIMNVNGTLRSITSFLLNIRHGIELIPGDKPEAIEWYNGKEIERYYVNDYSLERIDKDRITLKVSLSNNISAKMIGGRLLINKYENSYFDTYLEGCIYYPDGNFFSSINYCICNLKPYEGFAVMHFANGKCRTEEYKEYNLVKAYDENWDEAAMVKKQIPNPLHPADNCQAETWNNHIKYDFGGEYNGETVDGLPAGRGVLSFYDGRCYEGEFSDGRCNGVIVYSVEGRDIRRESVWKNGEMINNLADITLSYKWNSEEWSIGGKSDKSTKEGIFVPRLGESIDIEGFSYLKVYDISEDKIVIGSCSLRKGERLSFSNEVEGHEGSDGTVWNGTDYSIEIHWD